METFPRIGQELSSEGEVMFPQMTPEVFGIIVEFENGFKERRRTSQVERITFNLHCKLHQDDMNVVLAFLRARDFFVEPFFLVHPYLGTGIANYAETKMPMATWINGNPGWFEFDLPMEATF